MQPLMKFSQWYKSKIALVALAIAFLSVFGFSTAFAQSPQLTAKPSRLAKVIQDLQQSNQRWIQIDLPRQPDRLGRSISSLRGSDFHWQIVYSYSHRDFLNPDAPSLRAHAGQ